MSKSIPPSYYSDSEPEEHPGSAPPDAVVKTYGVYKTGTGVNFVVRQGGSHGPCLYYINNSAFTPGTPDVQVRLGGSKDGPIVAFAKFHVLSGDIGLALGNPSDEGGGNTIHEEMKKESRIAHKEYVFETDLGPDGTRRKYIWRRTIGKGGFANYACLDGGTGKLMAYFSKTGMKSMKKVGKLCFTSASTTDQLDLLVLLSWLGLREREVRSAWYAGGIIAGTTGT